MDRDDLVRALLRISSNLAGQLDPQHGLRASNARRLSEDIRDVLKDEGHFGPESWRLLSAALDTFSSTSSDMPFSAAAQHLSIFPALIQELSISTVPAAVPRTTLTSLPAELISRIILFSSDKPDYYRQVFAKRLAETCRYLHRCAQPVVDAELHLRNREQIDAVARLFREKKKDALAVRHFSVEIGLGHLEMIPAPEDVWPGRDLVSLVGMCTEVTSLSLDLHPYDYLSGMNDPSSDEAGHTVLEVTGLARGHLEGLISNLIHLRQLAVPLTSPLFACEALQAALWSFSRNLTTIRVGESACPLVMRLDDHFPPEVWLPGIARRNVTSLALPWYPLPPITACDIIACMAPNPQETVATMPLQYLEITLDLDGQGGIALRQDIKDLFRRLPALEHLKLRLVRAREQMLGGFPDTLVEALRPCRMLHTLEISVLGATMGLSRALVGLPVAHIVLVLAKDISHNFFSYLQYDLCRKETLRSLTLGLPAPPPYDPSQWTTANLKALLDEAAVEGVEVSFINKDLEHEWLYAMRE
ncbi:hypothetical protein JCM10207_002250 [Rhodosporidiobolus poonsookiae]